MASRSRPTSVSTSSSLMQDVPGSFPPPSRTPTIANSQSHSEDEQEEQPEAYQSLAQVVYSRRKEYVRPRNVRIKIGTWNVASFKGTEKDVGGWFVGGKGIADGLTGLNLDDQPRTESVEDVADQEARYARKQETLPLGDTGVLPGDTDVGLYVLSLQEVVDISSAAEALRPYTDPATANKWKDAMTAALPKGYTLVAEQQLIGLLLLIYAAPDVSKDIQQSSVSTTSIGTGLLGYMGNKGAVTARIVLGETTRLVFINSHLAAGADKTSLERRNWDAAQILSRTRFEPIQDAMDLSQTTGEQIGDEDFAFWCGDLNYRLEGIPGDDVRRLLMLHTRNEYDLSKQAARKVEREIQEAAESAKERMPEDSSTQSVSTNRSARSSVDARRSIDSNRTTTTLGEEIMHSEDPAALQTTLSSLLPHDELLQQIKSRKAFHDGWREGPITFLPTYKYDPGSVGVFDSSEKKRAPSWCDRILYRTRRDKLAHEAKIHEEIKSRKMDDEMRASGIDEAANDDELLYDYDPETDGADALDEYDEYDGVEEGVVITKEGFDDEIHLEYYTAHQRVLSSDHKPLVASFMLKFDAVEPELKAKIHAEAARELDKTENESRPDVTVVVDKHNSTPASADDGPADKFEGVSFGDIRWAQSKHRSLTVANTSRVPASFSFIERPVDAGQAAGIAPKWLSMLINGRPIPSTSTSSELITLEPGETCAVDLELRIMSMDDVRSLNDNDRTLDEILVLRVENGGDQFIGLRGTWLGSSLSRSVAKLVRIPEGGVRKLQRQKPSDKGKAVKAAVSAANAFSNMLPGGESSSKSENMAGAQKPSSSDDDEPVRFSAPKMLFRLTESIEELGVRVVAEWDMTNSGNRAMDSGDSLAPARTAPWEEHVAWPFAEECWTERTTSHWLTAMSDACDALDDDKPLEPSLPEDLPRIQRLYVLSSLLILFLKSMPDGIVPVELWSQVERYLQEKEKAKVKPPNEDQRIAIQEILSQSPSHSISFVLITTMLERMILERMILERASTNRNKEDMTLNPKKPGGAFQKIATFGRVPQAPQREQAGPALAKVFAEPLIRVDVVGGDRGRNAQQRRKADMIELFLRRDDVST
ncbi:related to inositol polyphosphate 5-phosphatase ocrl-1 [Ramularia collo-cygni]|uniref:Related to inositol polyphosphate 5-phosphatase ocrl-1 n=1 Tax=Ramularia collo-cygni TaxID=112498 RepID=A0A2D3VFP8_9PEZI|nr:related to inositol polyphosphate 5-phosphatase ocrl-1 [Ramularia collo-cygni]CZT21724.1 related to inositol polyphosphate 5-phosphatase ocrl-1 [Ramularia collo-cygni]